MVKKKKKRKTRKNKIDRIPSWLAVLVLLFPFLVSCGYLVTAFGFHLLLLRLTFIKHLINGIADTWMTHYSNFCLRIEFNCRRISLANCFSWFELFWIWFTPSAWGKLTRLCSATSLACFSGRRFWGTDGNRKWLFFFFNFSSHYYIYIVTYLSSSRDENLGETTVLACEMLTSERMKKQEWREEKIRGTSLFSLSEYSIK